MAVTLGQLDLIFVVDSAGFQSCLANAEPQAKSYGSNITKALATGAKVAFGAAVVGVGALGAVLAQVSGDIGEFVRRLPHEVRADTEDALLEAAIDGDYEDLIKRAGDYLTSRITEEGE